MLPAYHLCLCLLGRQAIDRGDEGKALAEAPNRRLAVFPIIRRSCTNFLTRPNAYLPACLPTCLPNCLPACLPTYIPTCLPTCIPACLPTVSVSGLIRGRGRPNQRLSLIRIVPYGRSLAVYLNSGSPRRP